MNMANMQPNNSCRGVELSSATDHRTTACDLPGAKELVDAQWLWIWLEAWLWTFGGMSYLSGIITYERGQLSRCLKWMWYELFLPYGLMLITVGLQFVDVRMCFNAVYL